jgi:hypothetical protein
MGAKLARYAGPPRTAPHPHPHPHRTAPHRNRNRNRNRNCTASHLHALLRGKQGLHEPLGLPRHVGHAVQRSTPSHECVGAKANLLAKPTRRLHTKGCPQEHQCAHTHTSGERGLWSPEMGQGPLLQGPSPCSPSTSTCENRRAHTQGHKGEGVSPRSVSARSTTSTRTYLKYSFSTNENASTP